MTIFVRERALATALGHDRTTTSAQTRARARARAFGHARLIHGAPPTPGAVPDALRLEILTSAGTQLKNDLATRRNLSFTVEHNGSGNINFETDVDALTDGIDSPLLDPSNLVRVHYGDLPSWPYGVAEGFITSAPPVKDDTGRWVLAVQCPGSFDVLDFGVLWPPIGTAGDTREFSYTAGMTGPAFVPEQWSTPVAKRVKDSFRWTGKRRPRGWPEGQSSWLWSSSPDKKSPLGTRQFVSVAVSLSATTEIHFYTAGDDTLRLYCNGALMKTKPRDGWFRTASFKRTLPAGTYTFAAAVSNVAGENAKGGFIFAAAKLKKNGDRDSWWLRSAANSFRVKVGDSYFGQVPLPPDGWYPAAVLYTHVGEAAARGCDFHSAITRTFSVTADSTGSAWTAKGPAEYDIGISGAELAEKIRAAGVDVAMLPGLRLAAWKSRGFDLRSRVTLAKPGGVGWSSRAWPRVRTVALTHQEAGWTETVGDTSEFGRREMALSAGGVEGDVSAAAFATAAMNGAGSPEETIELTYTSADDLPQPFRDYNVADIVSMETIGGFTPVKVMSITGAEQDDKSVNWTIAGYPV